MNSVNAIRNGMTNPMPRRSRRRAHAEFPCRLAAAAWPGGECLDARTAVSLMALPPLLLMPEGDGSCQGPGPGLPEAGRAGRWSAGHLEALGLGVLDHLALEGAERLL